MDGCIISAENVHREVGGVSMGGSRAPFLLKRSGLRTGDVLQIANISPKHVQVCNDGVVCASLAFVSNRLCDADAAANPGYFQRQGCVLLHHLTRPLNSRKNTFRIQYNSDWRRKGDREAQADRDIQGREYY
jgi:hypothetical protein